MTPFRVTTRAPWNSLKSLGTLNRHPKRPRFIKLELKKFPVGSQLRKVTTVLNTGIKPKRTRKTKLGSTTLRQHSRQVRPVRSPPIRPPTCPYFSRHRVKHLRILRVTVLLFRCPYLSIKALKQLTGRVLAMTVIQVLSLAPLRAVPPRLSAGAAGGHPGATYLVPLPPLSVLTDVFRLTTWDLQKR